MLYRNITLLPNITEVESVETVEASCLVYVGVCA